MAPSQETCPAEGCPIGYAVRSIVKHGYGRGSRDLGTPTANLTTETSEELSEILKNHGGTGIYYGLCRVSADPTVYRMVMSLGYNPCYGNKEKSAEVHVLHVFPDDFYGEDIRVLVVDYIRPEKKFDSLDHLIREIKNDIAIANSKLSKLSKQIYENLSEKVASL